MSSFLVSAFYAILFFLTTLEAVSHKHVQVLETKLIKMINKERAKKNLRPLRHWSKLTQCARRHSKNMAKQRVPIGHYGFKERAQGIKKHSLWSLFGENVAYSLNVKDHLKTAVSGWMNSPGHRKNILRNFKETGIGIAIGKDGAFYITQLFASRLT